MTKKTQTKVKATPKGKGKDKDEYVIESLSQRKRKFKKALEYLSSTDYVYTFASSSDEESDDDEGDESSEEESSEEESSEEESSEVDSSEEDSSEEESSSDSSDEYITKRHRGTKQKTRATKHAPRPARLPAPPSTELEPAGPSRPYSYEDEQAYSKNFFHRHVLSEMYPDKLKIKPNRAFDADDCALIANLEARQHALKYHYLQAEFCNVTGRMVPLEALRDTIESARPRKS